MIRKGYPVTWLFLFFILAAYIILAVRSMQNENARLNNIIDQQVIIINEQQKKVKDMDRLINVMFEYIDTHQLRGRGSDPIESGSPWYEDIDNRLI